MNEWWESAPFKFDAYGSIQELFYRRPTKYLATVRAVSGWPKCEFEERFEFTLTPKDRDNVRLNIVALTNNPLNALLGRDEFNFNFAYPEKTPLANGQGSSAKMKKMPSAA